MYIYILHVWIARKVIPSLTHVLWSPTNESNFKWELVVLFSCFSSFLLPLLHKGQNWEVWILAVDLCGSSRATLDLLAVSLINALLIWPISWMFMSCWKLGILFCLSAVIRGFHYTVRSLILSNKPLRSSEDIWIYIEINLHTRGLVYY